MLDPKVLLVQRSHLFITSLNTFKVPEAFKRERKHSTDPTPLSIIQIYRIMEIPEVQEEYQNLGNVESFNSAQFIRPIYLTNYHPL